jgi:hypothetical protein
MLIQTDDMRVRLAEETAPGAAFQPTGNPHRAEGPNAARKAGGFPEEEHLENRITK